MTNEALYNKTVNILVDAYFNDTLKHGNCAACAVGNIVAANKGYKFLNVVSNIQWDTAFGSSWGSVFYTDRSLRCPKQKFFTGEYKGKARDEIDSTGYDLPDLMKIEYAFEMAPKGKTSEDWMFNGLMAVIEVLDQIHGNTDTSITSTTKARFNKQLV